MKYCGLTRSKVFDYLQSEISELVGDSCASQGFGVQKGYLYGEVLSGQEAKERFSKGEVDHYIVKIALPSNQCLRILVQHGDDSFEDLGFLPKSDKKNWDMQLSCHSGYCPSQKDSMLFSDNMGPSRATLWSFLGKTLFACWRDI